MTMKLPGKLTVARFWKKVDRRSPGECWPWMAGAVSFGYGQFRIGARILLAHRVAYMLHHGKAIDGLIVRHHCDNPACCNPAHLCLGTHADNVADRQARGRTARGARNGRAKLTPQQVAAICASDLTDLEVAVRLRIDKTTVRKIREGRTWRGESLGSVWEGPAAIPFMRKSK